uniref:Similar to n=1 Tax=Caenorhabditis tropicalis TaxID=1561998 RepID=A0A1I7TUC0_9PELO
MNYTPGSYLQNLLKRSASNDGSEHNNGAASSSFSRRLPPRPPFESSHSTASNPSSSSNAPRRMINLRSVSDRQGADRKSGETPNPLNMRSANSSGPDLHKISQIHAFILSKMPEGEAKERFLRSIMDLEGPDSRRGSRDDVGSPKLKKTNSKSSVNSSSNVLKANVFWWNKTEKT